MSTPSPSMKSSIDAPNHDPLARAMGKALRDFNLDEPGSADKVRELHAMGASIDPESAERCMRLVTAAWIRLDPGATEKMTLLYELGLRMSVADGEKATSSTLLDVTAEEPGAMERLVFLRDSHAAFNQGSLDRFTQIAASDAMNENGNGVDRMRLGVALGGKIPPERVSQHIQRALNDALNGNIDATKLERRVSLFKDVGIGMKADVFDLMSKRAVLEYTHGTTVLEAMSRMKRLEMDQTPENSEQAEISKFNLTSLGSRMSKKLLGMAPTAQKPLSQGPGLRNGLRS